jgi:hypothetical protein
VFVFQAEAGGKDAAARQGKGGSFGVEAHAAGVPEVHALYIEGFAIAGRSYSSQHRLLNVLSLGAHPPDSEVSLQFHTEIVLRT